MTVDYQNLTTRLERAANRRAADFKDYDADLLREAASAIETLLEADRLLRAVEVWASNWWHAPLLLSQHTPSWIEPVRAYVSSVPTTESACECCDGVGTVPNPANGDPNQHWADQPPLPCPLCAVSEVEEGADTGNDAWSLSQETLDAVNATKTAVGAGAAWPSVEDIETAAIALRLRYNSESQWERLLPSVQDTYRATAEVVLRAVRVPTPTDTQILESVAAREMGNCTHEMVSPYDCRRCIARRALRLIADYRDENGAVVSSNPEPPCHLGHYAPFAECPNGECQGERRRRAGQSVTEPDDAYGKFADCGACNGLGGAHKYIGCVDRAVGEGTPDPPACRSCGTSHAECWAHVRRDETPCCDACYWGGTHR